MSVPASTAAVAPLSVAQEALWYAHQLAPDTRLYNESIEIHHDGPLDIGALRRAFAEILRRHEAWRTHFDLHAGAPVQIVGEPPRLPLACVDLSALDAVGAREQAARLTGRLARAPYDLRHGPLVRPRLIHLPGGVQRLVLAMHHIVFDGVCVSRVILPELVLLYDAARAGHATPLAPPPAQYRDYARWQQEWITEARVTRRLDHWRRRLDGAPSLPLALDRVRPAQRRHRGQIVPLRIPSETVRRARETAQRHGATLFQVLAAAWALVLAVRSGELDIVFGTAADLRTRREFEALVGYCLTSLVVRVDLSGDPSFGELVRRVRNDLIDGIENLVPFERLVRELGHPRALAANPVFRTMIILEPAYATPDPAWSLHQIAGDVDAAIGTSKLDLELQLDERPDGHLDGRLVYDTDLFEVDTAVDVARQWRETLAAAVADPDAPLSAPALSGGTARAIAVWNATEAEPPWSTLAEAVEAIGGNSADASGSAGQSSRGAGTRSRAPISGPPGVAVAVISSEDLIRAASGRGAGLTDANLLRALGIVVDADATGAPRDGTPPTTPSERAVLSAAVALAGELGLGPHDTVLSSRAALRHSPALSLWAPLLAGAHLVVPAGDIDGAALGAVVRSHDVTVLHAGPADFRALIATGLPRRRGLTALSSGSALARELADELLARFRTVWNAYGTAATAGLATLARVEPGSAVTIGRPVAGTRIDVVDAYGRSLPLGTTGELVISGDHLARTSASVRERADGALAQWTEDRGRWLPSGELSLEPPPT